ncbi:MAG TPA: pirin family protein [Methylomirabilota bacterium]|nr:pirin family protein [Methylomirabilota bacterium]
MITVRPGKERGHFDHGWLDTYHTFSFSQYHDPAHMGFRSLRVINEDRVEPGAGFPPHSHRDMEIITYVLAGGLAHKDSMGNASTIRPGNVQRMSAGTGVTHSEYNGSDTEPVHLLQIWILPQARNLPPSYEEKIFSAADKQGRLRLVASQDARDGSARIHQDASVYASLLEPGQTVRHPLAAGRGAWIHLVSGAATVNGKLLTTGDGAAIEQEADVEIVATAATELLLFDLA